MTGEKPEPRRIDGACVPLERGDGRTQGCARHLERIKVKQSKTNQNKVVWHKIFAYFRVFSDILAWQWMPSSRVNRLWLALAAFLSTPALLSAAEAPAAAHDPQQDLERTCFQTGSPFSEAGNLGSDVAIAYGIGSDLPDRIGTWRAHGYRIHVMTGVAWGQYQDYIHGKFDGVSHADEEQTDRDGNPHLHDSRNSDVFYMCPGTNYGRFLCVGIQRALDAGAEAIHLEEPEFWVKDGYEEAFKREWRSYYGEDWQAPDSSPEAEWRASKLKYFLYRRALQQVFDYVQDYNRHSGRHVRCYVPTHSLLNYCQWRIVSPESSLARLNGCDGYIAQVWTGTSRTPNTYRGERRERTFDTAFLEYGAMQNLVRATGRTVWYLNDPVEDNPNHDWNDYRRNWECTLTASLFQPEVWRYEVAPWPERIFRGRYPRQANREDRKSIPPAYATELQTVMNALNDMHQEKIARECGTTNVGVLISDSLMFERGGPSPSELWLGHIYGMAMPLLKHGLPITPVQLENVTVPHYLDGLRLLLLTYQGMKPLTPDVHAALADWVRQGGVLLVCDDDSDPFNHIREWWNSGGSDATPSLHFATPREHLFQQLGVAINPPEAGKAATFVKAGRGGVLWLHENPVNIAASAEGEARLMQTTKQAAEHAGLKWRETNYLLLRRGPYIVAAGLDESIGGEAHVLKGRFVNLFDPELRVQPTITLAPGSHYLLLDLDVVGDSDAKAKVKVLASACKAYPLKHDGETYSLMFEGVGKTDAALLLRAPKVPAAVTLAGQPLSDFNYSGADGLLWIRCTNEATPRELSIRF